MTTLRCKPQPLGKRPTLFIKETKVVEELYYESLNSFIFKLLHFQGRAIESQVVIKLVVTNEEDRSVPYFYDTREREYDAYKEHQIKKRVMKLSSFEQEKNTQQVIYHAMLPYGHFCPRVLEANILYENIYVFLGSFTANTDISARMLSFLRRNLRRTDSVGYIIMEHIPETYISFNDFCDTNPVEVVQPRCIYAIARLCMVFLITNVCNTDVHLGNMLTLRTDGPDSVKFIDFGRAVNKFDYEPYRSQRSKRQRLDEQTEKHNRAKASKRYSEQYKTPAYDLEQLKQIDSDTVFRVIRHYIIIDYECNWRAPKCRELMNYLFPKSNLHNVMDYDTNDVLFSDAWFYKEEANNDLESIAKIIRETLNHSNPTVTERVSPVYQPTWAVPQSETVERSSSVVHPTPAVIQTPAAHSARSLSQAMVPSTPVYAPNEGLNDRVSPTHEPKATWTTRIHEKFPVTQHITFDRVTKTFLVLCVGASLYYAFGNKTKKKKGKGKGKGKGKETKQKGKNKTKKQIASR
jgi:hypothetical protein